MATDFDSRKSVDDPRLQRCSGSLMRWAEVCRIGNGFRVGEGRLEGLGSCQRNPRGKGWRVTQAPGCRRKAKGQVKLSRRNGWAGDCEDGSRAPEGERRMDGLLLPSLAWGDEEGSERPDMGGRPEGL